MSTALAFRREVETRIRNKYIGKKNTPALRKQMEREVKGALSKFQHKVSNEIRILPDVHAPTITHNRYYNAQQVYQNLHVTTAASLGAYGYEGTGTGITFGQGVGYTTGNITINGTAGWNQIYTNDDQVTYGYAAGAYQSETAYKVEVKVPVIMGDTEFSKLPGFMKKVREFAIGLLQPQLPAKEFMCRRPISMGFIHRMDEYLDEIIDPAVAVSVKADPINPDALVFDGQEISDCGRYATLKFYYRAVYTPKLLMEMDEDIVRHYTKERQLEEMKAIIRRRHKPQVPHKQKAMMPMTALQAQEVKARETLRDMITESEWRRYLTNGFIMVKAPSGLVYQLFPKSKGNINVYKDNKKVESICIHTDNECPPTDHVINMKILVELDEQALRSGGNIHKAHNYVDLQGQGARLRAGIANHLQGAATAGIVSQASVDGVRSRNRGLAQLEELRKSSESLVSIYQKLRTA